MAVNTEAGVSSRDRGKGKVFCARGPAGTRRKMTGGALKYGTERRTRPRGPRPATNPARPLSYTVFARFGHHCCMYRTCHYTALALISAISVERTAVCSWWPTSCYISDRLYFPPFYQQDLLGLPSLACGNYLSRLFGFSQRLVTARGVSDPRTRLATGELGVSEGR